MGLGPQSVEFEKAISKYQNRKFAVGTNSCTAALHLALQILDLPPDAEILIPTISFISAPHAVEYISRKIVFVDIQENDLCIDIEDLQKKISEKTKVIIPVHMGGQPCRMDRIVEVAEKHNLTVIEDVANAQGGEWQGKKLGSWGHIGTLSFEAKKNMTTGDGGMIIFDNPEWLNLLRKARWLGIDKDTWRRFSESDTSTSWHYEVDSLGYKYNINDIASTLGLCQLKKLDRVNKAKRKLIRTYLNELAGVGDLFLPTYDLEHGGYWLFIVHTDQRDKLIQFLASEGITCGVHFMPSHLHPYYRRHYPDTRLPVSERVWKRIVTLPLYASLSESEQAHVISSIKKFFKSPR
ncbi:MAG: UDP-4-amino-4-deoxy-L-arabinose--oxoglutarate aminotransferase [Elusimicrobia bacterium]|nr:UDP-4-amino-4-deoxy-L-arabinose--oxoglutarate aminotransferase [Elusimicrobiota bacterium]